MKRIKKQGFSMLLMALMLFGMFSLNARADDNVRPTSIKAVTANRTVRRGAEFKLRVRTGPSNADDDYLRWSIVRGKNVIRFDDDDRNDDEVEFKAVKSGTAVVRCRISGTNKRVSFKITVKNTAASGRIVRYGRSTRSVNAGSDFELKVRKRGGVRDNDLSWSIIRGKSVVRFDDKDLRDDDVDLVARKAGTAVVRCRIRGTSKKIDYKITVKAQRSVTLSHYGSSTKTIEVGDDFELKVRKSGRLSDSFLRWSIANTSIVGFDDDDRTDDEVEFKARRTGTTTVTCRNTQTNQKISYTIKVVPDRDYDDDDDDDDD